MINFDEPFGLTLVESMACGTPVIAINRGSIPEVIKDGVTGFVVKDINEAISKVSEISKIDRANCRKRVEENFTVDIMVDNYIKIFSEIVNKK
jgi:glycosyltransferase involved in cell wall biosynthesis